MDRRGALTLAYSGARIAYGAALLARPRRTAAPWLGEGLDRAAGRIGARGLGARDALLSAGALRAARHGGDPVPWLLALAASDLADIGATVADRDDVPRGAVTATALLAGAFCACGLALARGYSDR